MRYKVNVIIFWFFFFFLIRDLNVSEREEHIKILSSSYLHPPGLRTQSMRNISWILKKHLVSKTSLVFIAGWMKCSSQPFEQLRDTHASVFNFKESIAGYVRTCMALLQHSQTSDLKLSCICRCSKVMGQMQFNPLSCTCNWVLSTQFDKIIIG